MRGTQTFSLPPCRFNPFINCTSGGPLVRLGSDKDGGKYICLDEYLTRPGCIVYSLGSNGQYDFEEAILEASNSHVPRNAQRITQCDCLFRLGLRLPNGLTALWDRCPSADHAMLSPHIRLHVERHIASRRASHLSQDVCGPAHQLICQRESGNVQNVPRHHGGVEPHARGPSED